MRTRHLRRRIVCLALAALAVSFSGRPTALAALPSLHGEHPDTWAPGKFSVIVADVKAVTRHANGADFSATLVPRCSLSGSFDPGAHAELPVEFTAESTGTSSIRHPPETGATVVAVVIPHDKAWSVTIHVCTFMPDGEAMVTVKGLDDPKVAETLRKVRAARARGLARQSRGEGDEGRH